MIQRTRRRPTRRTTTVVIGAGQAGLSLSRRFVAAGHAHVVLERGHVGERWRSERWDSLRLLTPNWLNRLEGGPPQPKPNDFLAGADFLRYLRRYARASLAPVHEHVAVLAVEQHSGGFRVKTDSGEWDSRNVVVATGDSDVPFRPPAAALAPEHLLQLDANRYRSAAQLPPGGVLVVGAGPSGQQIAAELRDAGRRVVLAAGRHARMVRRYRDRDIWEWLADIGDLDRTIDEVPDPQAARRAPGFALTGRNGGEQLDLGTLARAGVTVTGRLEGFDGHRATFAADLADSLAGADRRMQDVLTRIDEHVESTPGAAGIPDGRPSAVELPDGPRSLDLVGEAISTVIWATGYRRSHSWLHVPVLDADGEFEQRRGVTEVPGLYVLGFRFQHRRSSHTIGGVGRDAAFLAARIPEADAPHRVSLPRRLSVRPALG